MVSSGQIWSNSCMLHGNDLDGTQLFLAAVLSSAQNTAFRRAPPMQLQPALLGQRHRKLPPWRNSGVRCCWGKGYNQVRTRWRRRWWWWRIWTCWNTMKQKVCRWMMYVLRDSCGNSCFKGILLDTQRAFRSRACKGCSDSLHNMTNCMFLKHARQLYQSNWDNQWQWTCKLSNSFIITYLESHNMSSYRKK